MRHSLYLAVATAFLMTAPSAADTVATDDYIRQSELGYSQMECAAIAAHAMMSSERRELLEHSLTQLRPVVEMLRRGEFQTFGYPFRDDFPFALRSMLESAWLSPSTDFLLGRYWEITLSAARRETDGGERGLATAEFERRNCRQINVASGMLTTIPERD